MKICLLLFALANAGGAERDATVARNDSGETNAAESVQPTKQPSPKVELTIVKHADLVKAIAAHKGKVVLVNFWANYDPVGKVQFARVVQLQEKFRDMGLVCISVSIDDKSEKNRNKVLNFLTGQKAFFPNYVVEDPESCMDAWDFVAEPAYLLFGKNGKLTKKFAIDPDAKTQFTLADIQTAVEKQLK